LLALVPILVGSMGGDPPRRAVSDADRSWTVWAGGFNNIADLHAATDSEVWAVGSNLVHFDGYQWRALDHRVAPASYRAISFSSDGTGWAVGNEIVVSISAVNWEDPTQLEGAYLNGVAPASDTDWWAVGGTGGSAPKGTIYRSQGRGWQLFKELGSSGSSLTDVWFRTPLDGWAVGHGGAILHYDGDTWVQQDLVEAEPLLAVVSRSARDVWVGGGRMPGPNNSGGRPAIFYFDGAQWHRQTVEGDAAIVDFSIHEEHVFALGGKGTVYSLEADRWLALPVQVPASVLRQATCLAVVPGGKSLLVGRSDGSIFRIDSATSRVQPNNSLEAVLGLAFVAPNRGWAVARDGALQFDGGKWREVETSHVLSRALDIDIAAQGNYGWAVGADGLVLRLEDEGWIETERPADVDLFRVTSDSQSSLWALGAQDFAIRQPHDFRVYRYVAARWSETWGHSAAVRDIDVTSSGRAWIAAEDGLWRFDDSQWHKAPLNVSAYAVDALSDSEAWIGGRGSLYHMHDGCWDEFVALPGPEAISRIQMGGNGTGWAVATNGYLLRYDGREWYPVRGPVDPAGEGSLPSQLYDLDVVGQAPDRHLWIAGSGRSIMSAPEASLAQRDPVPVATAVRPPPIPTDIFTPAAPTATPNFEGRCPPARHRTFLPQLRQSTQQ
jgi:photosystem II stability/assembly factor-like uncharacterized protein